MIDIAKLGLVIDSSQVAKARDWLLRFVKGAGEAEDAANKAGKNISGSFDALGTTAKRVFGAVAVYMSARELMTAADTYTSMVNSLKMTGESAEGAVSRLGELATIARETRSPLSSLTEMYQRVSISAKELGVTQDQVLKFTKNVGLALAQQSGPAEQASGALLQMSQALGGGVVRAEEFNSILEGGYPILLAAAKGIDEAGGSVAKLRKMMLDGRLTSKMFFDAVISQSKDLEETFAKTTPTIGQAFQVLRDSFTMAIGQVDSSLGVSTSVARALITLSGQFATAAQWVIDNLHNIAGALGTTAVAFTLLRLPTMISGIAGLATAFLRAAAAVKVFNVSLYTLRGALIATGIGAIAVAIGIVIAKFVELYQAIGSFGEAMTKMGELARLVWAAIGDSANAIPPALAAIWALARADFAKFIMSLQQMWANFLDTLQAGFVALGTFSDVIFDASSAAATAIQESEDKIKSLNDEAATAGAKAGEVLNRAWAPVAGKLKSFQNLIDAAKNSANTAIPTMEELNNQLNGGDAGGGGKGKEGKGGTDKAADKIKSLRQELMELTVEYNLGATAAAIWKAQTEAGVSATSAQGTEIANLILKAEEYRSVMKRIEEEQQKFRQGIQSVAGGLTDLWTSAMQGADAFKSKLGDLADQLGKILLNRAFMNILGMMGGNNPGSMLGKAVGWFTKGPSFESGGYTGNGPRFGGVDGKGGYYARLHPKEHVFNEGQMKSFGGTQQVAVSISVDDDGKIQTYVNRTFATGIKEYDKRMPQRVQKINQDPKKRGA